jgi:hypothetical protein
MNPRGDGTYGTLLQRDRRQLEATRLSNMRQCYFLSARNVPTLEWSGDIWPLPTHPKKALNKGFHTWKRNPRRGWTTYDDNEQVDDLARVSFNI